MSLSAILPSSLAQTAIRSFPIGATMSLDVGTIHFVGIGGIGMSGIAEILHNLGYKVQGSDASESGNVTRLRKLGITVHIGHKEENVQGASVVVKSTAVKMDNPEIAAARQLRLPVVRRSEMLAELMRLKMCVAVAGTHGKTTTTSLVASLFDAAGMEPTVINGGVINAYGTNAKIGKGDWMIVEADESDGTFTRLPITIGIITNIDPEHLDYYGDFEALKAAFYQFIDNLPFYGFGVLCIDHPEVQNLIGKIRDRRIISYGLSPQADVRARNVRIEPVGQYFDLVINDAQNESQVEIKDIYLPMHGEHNLRNSLAAIAVANALGMNIEAIRKALKGFEGVKRRFTHTGTVDGVTVIDDYGHHPVEIAATLSSARAAARASGGRVIAVVQPHRFTRVQSLFNEFCTCFNNADVVRIADIYTAGETPIEGIHKEALVEGVRNAGHRDVAVLESEKQLPEMIHGIAKSGDYVVCLGAGSITYWAQDLPKQLEALK
jgi:UDP-N-acetylmuramate--alanine ligase